MAILFPSVSGCFRCNTTLDSNTNTVVKDFISLSNRGNTSKRVRVRVQVSARIRGLEPVILSDSVSNTNAAAQAPAPTPTPTPVKPIKEEEEAKQNYHLNVGNAIRTLREEYPEMFYRELSLDIYREDIVFKDPINTFSGIENYKSVFWALRFHGRIFFKAVRVDIIHIYQPVKGTIMIRWTCHSVPRVPWETRGRFDGTSEYKFDKQGKIYQHRVHNVVLNVLPSFRVVSFSDVVVSLGWPSILNPNYFEVLTPFPAWERPYLASALEIEPEL